MNTKTAKILDGKALAETIQTELKAQIQTLQPQIGRPPGLAVLMVGDNPASAAYVRNKERACTKVGIASFGKNFPADATQTEIAQAIQDLNQDERVDGILVQLPLPNHLDSVCRWFASSQYGTTGTGRNGLTQLHPSRRDADVTGISNFFTGQTSCSCRAEYFGRKAPSFDATRS